MPPFVVLIKLLPFLLGHFAVKKIAVGESHSYLLNILREVRKCGNKVSYYARLYSLPPRSGFSSRSTIAI
jgi:hypothetical protein